MPRKREYIDRLPRGLDRLRGLSYEVVGRSIIEWAFQVPRWSALRILGQCERMGARRLDMDNGALLYRRDEIVSALERLRAGESPEIGRRRRLRQSLEPVERLARLRAIQVSPPGADSDRLRATVELPAGVSLAPGRLVIEFAGRDEFLVRLGAVVFALQNDYEGLISLVSETIPACKD